MSTSANGAVKTATKPTAQAVKLEVVPVQPKTETPKPKETAQETPPLEDRLLRLNQLFELQGKYNRLQASKQKLAEFDLNKAENITLSLNDYHNRSVSFETKNNEVIAEVIACLRKTIDDKIKAIEPLLKW
ncbi:MAG: hypothetical protein J0L83_14735 [Chitinophagales bacterium]|nr:hypothetical protein [Chitinophagales bacterium]